MTDTALDQLSRLAMKLVSIPSVSRHEQQITDWIANEVGGLPQVQVVHRQDDAIIFGRPGPWDVILAGHSDTVPEQGNMPPELRDGWIWGLGAADMKGALAVMLALAGRHDQTSLNPLFVVFGREELATSESVLAPLLATHSDLSKIPLAVVMEPTANHLQAGCLGNIRAELVFHGRAAHSARPWLGSNAIHAAISALQEVASAPPHDVMVGGLTFREVLSVTEIGGGIANNVVPDSVTCGINFRYAGNRTMADAESLLRQRIGTAGELSIRGHAAGAPVNVDNPLLERLRAAVNLPLEPKQAWTPVAEFASRGIDAVNFGPGDPDFAHRRDERVSLAALVSSLTILRNFLCA
ncbi:MAG: succinyl-diaminopimelate desuccinylase [Candidatus Dormibacteraceae bacterium]